jgi:hypothetical protein
MIKFFRKIRQNLLLKNKTGKYFKYAIGEIILVVIGILIALSINNWNDEKTNHKKGINYLKSLRSEMHNNLQELNKEEKRILDVIKYKEALINVMNSNEAIDSISDKTIYNLYQESFNIPLLTTIETSAVNEIISSGGLQYIKNDSIRKLVASWDTKSSFIKWQENNLNETFKNIYDLMVRQKLVNIKYFYSQAENYPQNIEAPSKVYSLKNMLLSEEFENLSFFHYGRTRFMIYTVYPKYRAQLEGMIDLIDKELEK